MISVKFTCHFCDHDWSTIESNMFFKKRSKMLVNIPDKMRRIKPMFFKKYFEQLKMLKI